MSLPETQKKLCLKQKTRNSEGGQALVEWVIMVGFFCAMAAAFSSEVNWKEVWKTSDQSSADLMKDHFPLVKREKTP